MPPCVQTCSRTEAVTPYLPPSLLHMPHAARPPHASAVFYSAAVRSSAALLCSPNPHLTTQLIWQARDQAR
eukprot:scaffold62993_cov52-Phaeocystis_antarctica.AAC.1